MWGKVVLYLKEHRLIGLHVACGGLTDVSIDEDNFIINVEDGMMLNIINEGKRDIESALRWQGLELNVQIMTHVVEKTTAEKDIEKLKLMFGDNLIIKGGK